MDTTLHIAIDLGASNGRVVLGRLDRDGLRLREVVRFEHHPVTRGASLVWDWDRIRDEVRRGLLAAADAGRAASVSCDAWAQDFGLLDDEGHLLGPPVSYRDARTQGMPQSFADIMAPDALVRRVGSVAAPITTLCQLRALALTEPEALARAEWLLHIADLVHQDLTGIAATDRTLATASQLCSLSAGDWDRELLGALAIPHRLLPPILDAPTIIGEVTSLPELRGTPVVLTAGHDTAAAAALLGGVDGGGAFLMSGTWSMLGVAATAVPVPKAPVRDGLAILGLPYHRWGLFRPLMGLWVIQDCRRAWGLSHEELVRAATAAQSDSVVDLESPRFSAPADMPGEIERFCRETGQRVPESIGETARVVFASMALNHALAVECLQEATGVPVRELRIVGGGSANELLCQLTADALGLPVVAGPIEATAIGNLLMQAQAVGALDAGNRGQPPISASSRPPSGSIVGEIGGCPWFPLHGYEPDRTADAGALDRLRALRARGDQRL